MTILKGNGIMGIKENETARNLYREGWNKNGEWKCAKCGTIIGRNLMGDKPFFLARQHAESCVEGKGK